MSAPEDEDAEYDVVLTRTTRRAMEELLPEAVAAATVRFISGLLRTEPHRVGKPLLEPLAGLRSARRGEYRVLYRIVDRRLVDRGRLGGPPSRRLPPVRRTSRPLQRDAGRGTRPP